ncbi:MAG: excinuclease ABC subunit UvrA [Candidatus Kapaibacterium sp.]
MSENQSRVKFISVKGAKLHNLKNIDVDIPRNKFTVITGVSGSGKSSLAFDTIYAEGQRRFVESLSAYARQFLERMAKPDVDSITGLPPAIAIEQRVPNKNPRSTVGTTTEIYDYLRILYGRIGTTICRECGAIVRKDTPDSAAKEIAKYPEATKLYLLFPLSEQATSLKNELSEFRKRGYFRIIKKDCNDIIDIEQDEIPDNLRPDDIYVVADRIALRYDEESMSRLTDSLENAFRAGSGRAAVRILDEGSTRKFSTIFECSECEIVYSEPEPKLFSFNNPFGACPHCQGFGRTVGIDEELVIPDRSRSIKQNAIMPFKTQTHSKHLEALLKIAPKYGINPDEPIDNLTDDQMKIVWDGVEKYIGINGFFSMLEEKNYKLHYRVLLSKYRGYTKCKHCGGSRLRTSARQVFIGGKNIPELIVTPLEKIFEFIKCLELDEYDRAVAGPLISEVEWRLQLLVDIGLGYLTLSRLSHTLSGGESQRISLSTALGSSLVGTLYVLDEPSIGMHPRDTGRLLKILNKLRNLGNTVIVVEHDPDIIRKADHIIDLGPAAGEHGGELIFAGSFDELMKNKKSVTAQYFSGKKKIQIPKKRSKGSGEAITIYNPRENNLKIDKVEFPLGCMTVVTGVSGSGKSTLVHDILYAGVKKQIGTYMGHAGTFKKITGYEGIQHVELVDQSSIGKSSRSTPATYTKVFDHIRELFSHTQAARQLGWKPGFFSFNVAGGRCEVCEGEGVITVDMQFLPDVQLECEACRGSRYKREAGNILFKGKSIVDVLNMTVDEAADFFQETNKILKKLKLLQDVGLGYLRLGQPSTMLSGGESQRIKLASHLESGNSGHALFIFDEPTTGLHIDDISNLLDCFRRLTKKGHSVIIIEHNMHVIASADHIIDLGPEAGDAGGMIVAIGTPEEIAEVKDSFTGKALKEFFRLNSTNG